MMSDVSTVASPLSIRNDLDRLAGHGAAQIGRIARWRLVGEALSSVLPAFPLAAAGAVVAMLFGASPVLVGLVALGLPAAAFIAFVSLRILRFRTGRGEALSWIDREGALKGRMRTADSYLARGAASAFEQAAIADAAGYLQAGAPLLEGAGGARVSLPAKASTIILSSVFVGVAAIVMALLWRTSVAEAGKPPTSPAEAIANILGIRDGMRASQVSDSLAEKATNGEGAAPTPGSRGSNGLRSDGSGGGGSNQTSDIDAMSGGATGAGDAAASTGGKQSAGPRLADQSPGFERAEPSVSDARDGRGGTAAQDAQPGGESANGNAGEREATPIASANAGARPQANNAQSGQSRKSGEDGNQAPQNESREGSQSQAQPGRGRSSQSGNGSNSGSSAQKASFGVSGLLLGVPMADQLTGTRNPGPARRRTIEGEPGPASASGAQALARGTGNGRTGTQPQPTRSQRETRLLSDWFARGDQR